MGPVTRLSTADLPDWERALALCQVTLFRAGRLMDQGVGANALGHPLRALAFLLEVLDQQPASPPLSAGEIVTTGTLTAALPISPGEHWAAHFSDITLAPLRVHFG